MHNGFIVRTMKGLMKDYIVGYEVEKKVLEYNFIGSLPTRIFSRLHKADELDFPKSLSVEYFLAIF